MSTHFTEIPNENEIPALMPKIKNVLTVRVQCAGHLACQHCDSHGVDVYAVGSKYGDAEVARCVGCGAAVEDCNALLECEVLVYWNNSLNLLSFPRQCPKCHVQIDDVDVKAEAERAARVRLNGDEEDAA